MEGKQAEYMAELVERAANLNGEELTTVIIDATSHSSNFSFSEILSLPNIRELQGTENSNYLDLLCIFAYGTWSDYKDAVSHLPLLNPEQILKLKQLTVLTLAVTRMVPYDTLMQELDISNVHELEDFLITNCIYVGIITGTLDHMKRCFKVQVAAGRDIETGQLDILVQNLESWLVKSDHLLTSIKENIIASESKHAMQCKHKKELNQTSSFKADNKARQRQGEEKALLDLAQELDIGQLLVSMKRKRIQRRL